MAWFVFVDFQLLLATVTEHWLETLYTQKLESLLEMRIQGIAILPILSFRDIVGKTKAEQSLIKSIIQIRLGIAPNWKWISKTIELETWAVTHWQQTRCVQMCFKHYFPRRVSIWIQIYIYGENRKKKREEEWIETKNIYIYIYPRIIYRFMDESRNNGNKTGDVRRKMK